MWPITLIDETRAEVAQVRAQFSNLAAQVHSIESRIILAQFEHHPTKSYLCADRPLACELGLGHNGAAEMPVANGETQRARSRRPHCETPLPPRC